MLDETVCPVCERKLDNREWVYDAPDSALQASRDNVLGIWAVAHYLAHLVQLDSARRDVGESLREDARPA